MIQTADSRLEVLVSSRAALQAELLANGQPRCLEAGGEWISHAGRREHWKLGRYFLISRMQRLLKEGGNPPKLDEFGVVTRNGLGRGTQPRIYLKGRMLPWRLSLSHGGEVFALAVSRDNSARVGIDVVDASAATRDSLGFWCTPAERKSLLSQDEHALVRNWAMKEAVYKAVNHGEAFSPSHFEIFSDGEKHVCHWRGQEIPLDIASIYPLTNGDYLAAVLIENFRSTRHVETNHRIKSTAACHLISP